MENFIFALNATMPIFLIIILGWFLQRVGLINESFNKTANDYVFKCALPISLFNSIAGMDFYSDFSISFCLFCIAVTTVMFFAVWGGVWLFVKDKGQVGAFAQAAVRSSASILGVTFAVLIYGEAGMVPMMIVAAVPFFNIYSVIILSFSPHVDEKGNIIPTAGDRLQAVKKACINVFTNPIILGIFAGLPFALLRIKIPTMLASALKSVGATASPLALIVVGASFSAGEAMSRLKNAAIASFIKLFLLPILFLPLAALCGFRETQMIAILILVGSPTTVTCYVMAKSMHADCVLTSNTVVIATLLSSVSLTFWIYLLRTFALI